MSDFTVIETTAYQWACQLCGETGSLEISREFAKEAAQGHRCHDEECYAELHTWDYFSARAVDPYLMRCDRRGNHEEHKHSETGATWR